MNIATRLREAREEAGLSQQQLAETAGVSQGTIANIESGIRKNPRELLSIAREVHVHPEWLKTGKGPRYLNDGQLPDSARPMTLRMAYRVGVVQGGDNGFIEPYEPSPTLQEPEPVPYAAARNDENAYAVKVRGNSMEPTIMAGWDVVASPSRPAEPPDLCVVHFTDGRKALKRLIWQRDGQICLESLNNSHAKMTEPSANVVRMDKVISIIPN